MLLILHHCFNLKLYLYCLIFLITVHCFENQIGSNWLASGFFGLVLSIKSDIWTDPKAIEPTVRSMNCLYWVIPYELNGSTPLLFLSLNEPNLKPTPSPSFKKKNLAAFHLMIFNKNPIQLPLNVPYLNLGMTCWVSNPHLMWDSWFEV